MSLVYHLERIYFALASVPSCLLKSIFFFFLHEPFCVFKIKLKLEPHVAFSNLRKSLEF